MINIIFDFIISMSTLLMTLLPIEILLYKRICYVISIFDKYKFYYHEYGHILKLKENLYKDIDNYIEEMKSHKINIQVVDFINTTKQKRKTYSNYFEYLENKKQGINYQKIIKDIAIGGYEFSKNTIKHIELHKLCIYFSNIITAFILLIIIISNINNIKYLLISGLIISIIFYVILIAIYLYFCRVAYGPPKVSDQSMSDHYIFKNPDKFKYINLKEDIKHIKGIPQILLEIKIDFSDKENPKVNIIKQDTTYKKITKKFPLE